MTQAEYDDLQEIMHRNHMWEKKWAGLPFITNSNQAALDRQKLIELLKQAIGGAIEVLQVDKKG